MMNSFVRYSWHISILGLISQILGVLSLAGSLQQQVLFLVGVTLLGIGAYLAKQRMFVAMQLVALVGVLLGFAKTLPIEWLYVVMGIAILLAIGYIVKTKSYLEDEFTVLGVVGLFLLALGFATNPSIQPILFNAYLVAGGVTIGFYSLLEIVARKIKIAWIFLILNIVFVVKPAIWLLNNL